MVEYKKGRRDCNQIVMNKLKVISSILISYCIAISCISSVQAASDSFGRLFTTPQERKNLQVIRFSEPEAEVEEAIEIFVEEIEEIVEEKAEPRDIEGITLNGLVYRKGGKSTVWLNGSNSYEGSLASEYFRINTGEVNNEKVSVTVPEVDLKFDLKVGQTYEPNDGSLLDIVEDDDEIAVSKK